MTELLDFISSNLQMIYIVVLMIFVGVEVIGHVPAVLHTPLMSGANAIHGVVIIGAILEGPVVGLGIGLIFGLFSMLQAAVAPTGVLDPLFVNPLLSVLPRLFIGPVAWLVWTGALQVDHGILTQGEVVALVNYMSQILVELIKLANLIVIITKAAACAGIIENVLRWNLL